MKTLRSFFLGVCFILCTLFVGLLLYTCIVPIDINTSHITIYDTHHQILYKSASTSDLALKDCPAFIQDAIVCVEDKRFFTHIGFDPLRILKSLYTNIMNASIVEGGSTITQQYAKNIFLNNKQTLTRKLKEIVLALQMEMQYSKDEILEGYMNSIYYGHGIYGFKNAASFYFNKEVDTLNLSEIALLIAIPNGPSYYSPLINIENAKGKRNQILYTLYKNKLISKDEYEQAIHSLIVLDNKEYTIENEKNYYIDVVLEQLDSMSYSGDLHVYTYYDPQVQTALSNAIKNNNPSETFQTSGIVVEPYSGNVVALQGGNNYTLSSYNRALYAKRQIASTIKPLLYYCALTQGFTPSTLFSSEETMFTLEDGSTYSPKNYNNIYPNKDISMIHALRTSDNIYAVKTHLFLGMDTLQNALEAFSFKSEANASLALGTIHLSIFDLSTIYNTFASEGYYIQPAFIDTIYDSNKVLYQRDTNLKQMLDRDTTLILNQLLTCTYDNNYIEDVYPTLYGKKPDVIAAVKSGTSNWDTWAIGYNPYYCVGIWNGYDNNQEIQKQEYEISKAIWQECFNTLMQDKSEIWYEPTNNIEIKKVHPISGKVLKDGSVYWYLR